MKNKNLIFISVASLILSFLAAGILAVNSLQKVISENDWELTESVAVSIYNEINAKMAEPRTVAEAMANGNSFYEAIQNNDEDYYAKYLSYIKDRFGYDTVFFINDSDGNYYTHEGWSTCVINHPTADWYWKLRESDRDFDFNIQLDEETSQKVTVFINQKIYDENGNYIGLCGVGTVIDIFGDIFRYYEETNDIKTYIVDEDGKVLIGNNEEIRDSDLLLAMSGATKNAEYNYSKKRQGGCIVTRYLENPGWQLVVVREETGSNPFSYLIIRLIVAFFAIALILAAGIYRHLMGLQKNYQHQYEMSKALSEGAGAVFFADFVKNTFRLEDIAEGMRNEMSAFLERQDKNFLESMKTYCQMFVHEDDRERMLAETRPENMQEKLKKRHSYFVQYRIKENPDHFVYFEMHVADTENTAREHKAFISFRCIDEQMEKEIEQRQALQEAFLTADRANSAKTVFMAQMSHEIRTPLNVIVGMMAIAEANRDNPEKIGYCLSKIQVSTRHLLGLVNEVLDMNRIESGKFELNNQAFRIENLMNEFTSAAIPLAEGKHHIFNINLQDIQHQNVMGDKERIRQCLMNFMSNAVKYTPEGGRISLTVRELKANRPKRGCYEFIFEDNGIGMTPEFVQTIFEPFARADDARIVGQQGTGLGMSIARTIIQMMSGDIQVESELNKGSRFTAAIFLELQDYDETQEYSRLNVVHDPEKSVEISHNSLDPYSENDFQGKRVLLVEDNALNAEITSEIIGMTGLTVEHVWNGEEAVSRMAGVKDYYYDLIFMDIQMPVMNGYDAVKAIRACERQYCRDIPIIALSANAFAEDVRMSKLCGMQDHIAKPIDFDRLLEILKLWLN